MPPTDLTQTTSGAEHDDAPAARGNGRGRRKLVIVESPAKAKTIAGLLGPEYVVESSIGHIRDLATRKDLPAAFKHESWADLAVDVDNGFKPVYIVSPEKKAQVTKLKKLAREAGEVYLATDEDREGESIAWHLSQVLDLPEGTPRMVFHEITPQAIQRAVDECRTIDSHLVEAQEARRIFDRIYGFKLSDVMRRKTNGRSAGRQHPALPLQSRDVTNVALRPRTTRPTRGEPDQRRFVVTLARLPVNPTHAQRLVDRLVPGQRRERAALLGKSQPHPRRGGVVGQQPAAKRCGISDDQLR